MGCYLAGLATESNGVEYWEHIRLRWQHSSLDTTSADVAFRKVIYIKAKARSLEGRAGKHCRWLRITTLVYFIVMTEQVTILPMKPRCAWLVCLALHNVNMHGHHFQTGINCYKKHFVQPGVVVKWTAYKDRVMTRERKRRFAAFYDVDIYRSSVEES